MLTLYYAPDTCALASHIALEHAGADYRLVRIDFASKQQRSAEYLRVNPKGRVPALVTERGVLTETPAILQFIAQRYPAAGLAPLDDPFELARMNAFHSYLCSTLHVAHAHRMRGYRWSDDPAAIVAMQKKVPQSVGECFELIETEFFVGPWVMGDALRRQRHVPVHAGAMDGGRWRRPARFPKVAAHRDRVRADPVVSRVIAAESAPP